jgi:predicted peptidase
MWWIRKGAAAISSDWPTASKRRSLPIIIAAVPAPEIAAMLHDRLPAARWAWTTALLALAVLIVAEIAPRRVTGDPTPLPDTYRRPLPGFVNLPAAPGDHRLKFKTQIGEHSVEMAYLLHLPADYGTPGVKSPVLVFLHGIGECGTDLNGIYALGPMTLLKAGTANPAFAASCPYVVLCPQCPPRGQQWSDDYMTRAVCELVEQTVKNARYCDPDRVYVTGLSMGGLGTWCVSEEDPAAFAAAAPLSAMKWNPESAGEKLRHVSIWAVAGMNDESRFVDGTREMQAALEKSDVKNRFTYLTNAGHEAFIPCYASPQFYEWFLSHRRPAEGKKAAAPATAEFPTTPGHHLLTFPVKVGDQQYQMDYVLYLPKPSKTETGPRPAMLFFHEQDTMGPAYKDMCVHGPDLVLEKNPGLQSNFPFVVISPRLPIRCDWDTPGMKEAILALVDHVGESVKLDSDRLVVTGINNGAAEALRLADAAPERFAAVAAVATDPAFNFPGDPTAVMKRMPGRVFVRASDKQITDRMAQWKSQTKLDWRMIIVPMSASPLGEVPAYGEHTFLTWLQQQKRTKN